MSEQQYYIQLCSAVVRWCCCPVTAAVVVDVFSIELEMKDHDKQIDCYDHCFAECLEFLNVFESGY